MTVREWVLRAADRLSGAGIESAKLESTLLAAHVLGVERTWIVAHPEAEINILAGESLLQRREAREPLAYILGWREFFGRRFEVRPGVLIPRQETEILVEVAKAEAGNGPVLDLGTGSGCIAITLKLEIPDLEVWASDVSSRALDVAKNNAEMLQSDVRFVSSDGFSKLGRKQFGLIVSNPPYISTGEELMPEVRIYEPEEALFSGPTGLEFYERLAREAPEHLIAGGKLAVEVGHTQSQAVSQILESQGWTQISAIRDLSGIERVVVGTSPQSNSLP
jgi:release factor glutamine methyltransferase